MHSYQNSPKESYTDIKKKHILSGYSSFTNCSFDKRKQKTWLLPRQRLYGNVL